MRFSNDMPVDNNPQLDDYVMIGKDSELPRKTSLGTIIKSAKEFTAIKPQLRYSDKVLEITHPSLEHLSDLNLDPKLVLLRYQRMTKRKEASSPKRQKKGWVVAMGSDFYDPTKLLSFHYPVIINPKSKYYVPVDFSTLCDNWRRKFISWYNVQSSAGPIFNYDEFEALTGPQRSEVINSGQIQFKRSCRKKSLYSSFGFAIRIENPEFTGNKTNFPYSTAYRGIPRYLYSQIAVFGISIVKGGMEVQSIHFGISIK